MTGVDLDLATLPLEAKLDGFVTFASVQVTSETQLRSYMGAAETAAAQVVLSDIVDCAT